MARKKRSGRFLIDLSDSEDFWGLQEECGPYAALLWSIVLIPNTDRYGCIKGTTSHLARRAAHSIVDFPREQMQEIINEMTRRNMVEPILSKDGTNTPGIRLLNFHEYQIGMRPERESRSIFEPEGWIEQFVSERGAKNVPRIKSPANAPSLPDNRRK